MKQVPLGTTTKAKVHLGYVALVDDEDYERVMQFKWHVCFVDKGPLRQKTVYAVRYAGGGKANQKSEGMHTFISGVKGTDHKDGDGLNNQRHNLRTATLSQNGGNKRKQAFKEGVPSLSKWKGVTWDKWAKRWKAQCAGKHLGHFREEFDAAQAYNFAAEEKYGEFARFNTPEGCS